MSAITWRQATKDDVGRLARFSDSVGGMWTYGLLVEFDGLENVFSCAWSAEYGDDHYSICEVQEVARRAIHPDVPNIESREDFIAREVDCCIDNLLNESLYWSMPDSEPVMLKEILAAIQDKLFDVAYEQGRLELHAEHVRDNCI